MFDFYRLIPRYWLQNRKTSYEWDKVLNELLNKHKPIPNGAHTHMLGNVEVWTSNYPYAYGYLYGGPRDKMPKPNPQELPTVKTRLRLRKAIKNAISPPNYKGLLDD